MIIKQLSIFLENKSGRLREVTRTLYEHNINMTALSIAETSDYGVLRVIVNNPELAEKVLKAEGFSVHITQVLCIIVPNEPGGLHRVIDILYQNNISVEYIYAFSHEKSASVVIRVDQIEKTIDILQKNQIALIKANEIYKI